MADFLMQEMIFFFIGGLGLFLFGLRFMSDALQLVAGDRMRRILETGTKTPIRGVVSGILATVITQSSSATAVLTIGLVNAGLLSLRQAIGVIMGVNIGTTITAFIIGFNFHVFALPILALGAFLYLFFRNRKLQLIGQVFLGFGMLFFGLTIMGEGMKDLKNLPFFLNLMSFIDKNALWGIIIGMGFTGLVQSSSATVGVIQQLAYQGAIAYHQAVPMLFGDNLGTTIIVLLAAVGTSVAARRTALSHFIFNIIGVLIWLPLFLLGILPRLAVFITNSIFALIPGFSSWDALNVKLQIAQTHAVFNVGTTIIWLPLLGLLVYLVSKLISERPDSEDDMGSINISKRFMDTPGVAVAHAMTETMRMGRLAARCFYNSVEYFRKRNPDHKLRGIRLEETINRMQREITDYVVAISEKRLSKEDSERTYLILQVLTDLERIGDHSLNIIEQADFALQNQVTFSGEAKEELGRLIRTTDEILTMALVVLDKGDQALARQIIDLDNEVGHLQEEFRRSHIRRLNERVCTGNNGAVFLDVISHVGRISNHCRNIAWYVLGEENPA